MESRFEADHELKAAYYDYLREYEELSHMTHLSWDEAWIEIACTYHTTAFERRKALLLNFAQFLTVW